MMTELRFFFLLVVFTCALLQVHGEVDINEIQKSIVKIRATIPNDAFTAPGLGTEREGNGVVIDTFGHIVTIGYLVMEAAQIEIEVQQGTTLKAFFVGYDFDTGFGLIKADGLVGTKPLQMGRSSETKRGDHAIVVGHGGEEASQAVRIMARSEFAGSWEYLLEDAIYTVPAFRNFGGAALLDERGRLIGIGSILTQVSVPSVGILPSNMFVPIDLFKPIFADLKTNGRAKGSPRPWLGINSDETQGRVFVIRVSSRGPAEKAGVRSGDIILKVGEEEVKGLSDFYRKVWSLGSAGVDVPLTVLQGTEIKRIIIQSSDRYQFLKLSPSRTMAITSGSRTIPYAREHPLNLRVVDSTSTRREPASQRVLQ